MTLLAVVAGVVLTLIAGLVAPLVIRLRNSDRRKP